MDISTRKTDNSCIVTVIGSIDALTADQLTGYLENRISGGDHRLILDLSQVHFMSSAGLRVILIGVKQARCQGGDLCLAAAQAGTARVLDMSGFLNILQSYPTVEEAVTYFKE